MSEFLLKMERYPLSRTIRRHGILATFSFLSYFCIIIFAFVPFTTKIEESGTSTIELQEATSKIVVDEINFKLQTVISDVYQLYFFDYLFILVGLILLFSIHSIIYLNISDHPTLKFIPLLGLVFTMISRSLDAFENLWVLLIVSNPNEYPSILIQLVNLTQSLKWIAVAFDYGFAVLGFIVLLKLKFSKNIETE